MVKGLVRGLQANNLVYRLSLKARGSTFHPGKIHAAWMNSALKSMAQWEKAIDALSKAGLHPHPDVPKNWDSAGTLDFILRNTSRASRILSAGSSDSDPLVEWLYLYGYENLDVINIAFDKDFTRGPISYRRGDVTETGYPNDYFDAVASISVIENDIDLEAFLHENHRILQPGGFLILSTDYWPRDIDTYAPLAFDRHLKVFSQGDIEAFLDIAKAVGFALTGPIDFEADERCLHWDEIGLEFTSILFALRKA